jgi:hypothetical protein
MWGTVTTWKVRRLERAGHLVRRSDEGPQKAIFGETRRKKKSRKTKIKVMEFIENDLKSMGVKR